MGFRWSDPLLLGVIVCVVFVGSLILRTGNPLYVSPDENANAFFAKQFAQTGTFSFFEPLNVAFEDALHPRSVFSRNGFLLPVGFLGLSAIYGMFIRLFGPDALSFLTPLFAAAGVFIFYGVIRRLFDREIALLSALLLAFHPAWWYYSSRVLMPNVLFTVLLLVAAYLILCLRDTERTLVLRRALLALSAGAAIGSALFVRTSEVVWIVPALVGAGVFLRKQLRVRDGLWFVAGLAGGLFPMFLLNFRTYGSAFDFGYWAQKQEIATVAEAFTADVEPSRSSFLPFTIQARAFAKNILDYGVEMFWWLSALCVAGAFFVWRASRGYVLLTLLVGILLVALYGGWTFFDNPNPQSVTIANSHVRYWLPGFVLLIPFAACALRQCVCLRPERWWKGGLTVIVLTVFFLLSVRVVFLSPEDGLIFARETLLRDKRVFEQTLLPLDAVMVVDRADKIFFPHRAVLQPLRDERTYQLLPRIAQTRPLYYYGITFPSQDMTYLNSEKLKGLGLQIEHLQTYDEESLYRLYEISD